MWPNGPCSDADGKMLQGTQINGKFGSADECLRACKREENVTACQYNKAKSIGYVTSKSECKFFTTSGVVQGSSFSSDNSRCWKIIPKQD